MTFCGGATLFDGRARGFEAELEVMGGEVWGDVAELLLFRERRNDFIVHWRGGRVLVNRRA